ncbi:hypothetical protein TeGR_g12760, partial [Tetraparma gracilis]
YTSTYGNLLRQEFLQPASGDTASRTKFTAELQKFPRGFGNVLFLTGLVRSEQPDGSVRISFAPLSDFDAASPAAKEIEAHLKMIPAASKSARGSLRGFWSFRELAPAVCEVTFLEEYELPSQLPSWVLSRRMKKELDFAKGVQDKFQRGGRLVDAELRSAFPQPPAISKLSKEQDKIVKSCLALAGTETDWAYSPASSGSVFVRASFAKPPAPPNAYCQPGSAVWRAECDVDCSMQEAAAWLFKETGRERTRAFREGGGQFRFKLRENTPHDAVYAVAHKLKIPLLRVRECVVRLIIVRKRAETLIAVVPSDDLIDYGEYRASDDSVRMHLHQLFVLKNDAESHGASGCKVILFTNFDIGGRMHISSLLTRQFQLQRLFVDTMLQLREGFQMDSAIDAGDRAAFARKIEVESQIYTDAEDAVLDRVGNELRGYGKSSSLFEPLSSNDHLVTTTLLRPSSNTSDLATVHSTATVDAKASACLAWEFLKSTRTAVQSRLYESVSVESSHNQKLRVLLRLSPLPGVSQRELQVQELWRKTGDKWESVSTSVPEGEEEARTPGCVRASITVLWQYKELDPVGTIPQTRVDCTYQFDAGGYMSRSRSAAASTSARFSLMTRLSSMRSEFDDMYNIDRESRERAKRQIGQNKLKRGQSASDILAQSHGQAWFDRFEEHKPVPDTPSANPDVKFRSAKHTTMNEVWSLAETTIPASKEDVLAYLWDMDARCRWREGDQERRVVEHVSASEMVCHTRSLRPRGVREAVTRYTWFRPTATSIMLFGKR